MARELSAATGSDADWNMDPTEESPSPSNSSTSIIAKYISRFRSAPPTPPVNRIHNKLEVEAFWWLSEDQLERQERRSHLDDHLLSFESEDSGLERAQQHDLAASYPPASPPPAPSAVAPLSSSSSSSSSPPPPPPPLRVSPHASLPSRSILETSIEQSLFTMTREAPIERPASGGPSLPSHARVPDLDRRVDHLLALADQVILSYRGTGRGDPSDSWDSTLLNTRESTDTSSSAESLSPLQFTRKHADDVLSQTSARPTWVSSVASSPSSSHLTISEASLSLRESKEEPPSPTALSSSGHMLPPLSPVRSPVRRAPPVPVQSGSSPLARSLQEELDSGSLCLSGSSLSSSGNIFALLPARHSKESAEGCAVEVTEALVRPFLHDDLIRQLWERLCSVNLQLQQLDAKRSDKPDSTADS